MKKNQVKLVTALVSGLVLVGSSAATAGSGESQRHGSDDDNTATTRMIGYQEVPAVSTAASGRFRATLAADGDSATYRLTFSGISSPVLQSHIHFGQRSVNGAISLFLCSNLGNGPAGTPLCPQSGTVTGTLSAEDVIGPAAQGIAAGEFAEVVAAVGAGVAYVNVHSDAFQGGEIRGQLVVD